MGDAARVRQVIDEYLHRRAAGEAIGRKHLIAAHPELMPELGTELRKLALIESAFQYVDHAPMTEDADTGAAFNTDGQDAAPPPSSFTGYVVVSTIHHDQRSVVYRATQTATGKDVAIKAAPQQSWHGLRNETRLARRARLLGSLNHPSLVKILDSGTTAGYCYYIMDYITGEPLDACVTSEERAVKDTLRLFSKICHAVNAGHVRGVIHRNIKPNNIRVDADGEPHILDFGLAEITGAAACEPALQMMAGAARHVESLPWASPEQVGQGAGGVDARSDVYSLGVMLFQILTGRFPYEVEGDISAVVDRIVTAEPVEPRRLLRHIDTEVEAIVLKCLDKEQGRRYQSAGELARDIDRYLCGQPIDALRTNTWYVAKKAMRRYRLPLAVAAGLALLIGVMAMMTSKHRLAGADEQDQSPHQSRSDSSHSCHPSGRVRPIKEPNAEEATEENMVA